MTMKRVIMKMKKVITKRTMMLNVITKIARMVAVKKSITMVNMNKNELCPRVPSAMGLHSSTCPLQMASKLSRCTSAGLQNIASGLSLNCLFSMSTSAAFLLVFHVRNGSLCEYCRY